jgi:predicted transposase/invertase (TIGR01784 family)
MLRNKADFAIFEGLISVLVKDKVTIVELLDTESNKETRDDKYNRVDIKARNSKGEIILVEIQQTRERDYLQRMLYGVAKTITEHIDLGDKYNQVKKVYSISIVYFDLGKGSDYVYHGQNQFFGIHTNDELIVNQRDKDTIRMVTPTSIFPEYYIIRVNEFDKVATTPLDEWLEYLKNGRIKDGTTTPGLAQAKKKLQYLQMTPAERTAYDRHINNIMIQNDVLETKVLEGLERGLEQGMKKGMEKGMEQGRAEGMEQGRAEERLANARKMKAKGFPISDIAEITGLSTGEIEQL